jgi:type I restriction enzyme S subunit
MERYDKYKDSGFDWIGEIPEHWKFEKLGWQGEFSASGIDKKTLKGEPLVNMINYTDVYGNEKLTLTNDKKYMVVSCPETKKQIHQVEIGDLVFTPSSETIDEIGLSALVIEELPDTVYSYHVIRLKFEKDFDIVFRKYLCNNNFVLNQFSKEAKGTTRQIIGRDVFKNIGVVIPPKTEQTAIANYLDRKTGEIDELIAQKERLLEIYEEEKTAIINQAVTKGINPDVKLKNSGMDWLGEVPKHWEVKKLKYLAKANPSNIDKKSKDGEYEVLLCNYVDIYKNDFINSELDFMKATASESQIEKFILEKGDVIATKDSETPDDIGNPALVVEDFENVVCGYHLTHIKPIEINGAFLFRFIQTQFLKSYFEVSANGVTRYGLGVDKFNSALILCPPIEEQSSIVEYINNETERIKTKFKNTKKLIELLKEYKTSLISEVVTGKVKVN